MVMVINIIPKNKEAELNAARALYAVLPEKLKAEVCAYFPSRCRRARAMDYTQTFS